MTVSNIEAYQSRYSLMGKVFALTLHPIQWSRQLDNPLLDPQTTRWLDDSTTRWIVGTSELLGNRNCWDNSTVSVLETKDDSDWYLPSTFEAPSERLIVHLCCFSNTKSSLPPSISFSNQLSLRQNKWRQTRYLASYREALMKRKPSTSLVSTSVSSPTSRVSIESSSAAPTSYLYVSSGILSKPR